MAHSSTGQVSIEYLNLAQAAALVGFHPTHLVRLAKKGDGPPRSKVGRSVRYRRRDLIAWMAALQEKPEAA